MPDSSSKRTRTQLAQAGRRRARVAKRKENQKKWEEQRQERMRDHAALKADVLATKEIREAQALLNKVELLSDRVDTYFKLGISRMAEEFGPLLEEELKAAHEGDARARRWVLENMVKWKPAKETSSSIEQDAMQAMAAAAAEGNVAEMTLRVEPHDPASTAKPVGESVESTDWEVTARSV